jgi:hypothetical protein
MDHPLVLAIFLAVAAAGAWRVFANSLHRNFRHFAYGKQLARSLSLYRRDIAASAFVKPVRHGVDKQQYAARNLAARRI